MHCTQYVTQGGVTGASTVQTRETLDGQTSTNLTADGSRPLALLGGHDGPKLLERAAPELLGHHKVPQSPKSAFFHVSGHSPTVSE
jgi:hypothetical protein